MVKYPLIVLMSLIFCWGSKIQIVQSTSQEWVGGLQESGYGTDYKLTIKVKAGSDQLQIQDLWVGDQYMKLRVIVDPANPQVKTFTRGALLTCKSGVVIKPGAGQVTGISEAGKPEKPVNFAGEGLLGYTWKGRKAYLEITEFKKLEKIIYP